MACNFLVEGGQSCRSADAAQRVEFVAQTDVAHRERLLHIRILVIVHRAAILLESVEGDGGSIHALMIVHSVGTIGELALLAADEGGDALCLVAGSCTDVAIIAIAEVVASGSIHCLLVEYDVEHAARTFSIIFGSRIGDYFYVFTIVAGIALKICEGLAENIGFGFPSTYTLKLDEPFTVI